MTVQLPPPPAGLPGLETLVEQIMKIQAPGLPAREFTRWAEDFQARLARVRQHPEQNTGRTVLAQ